MLHIVCCPLFDSLSILDNFELDFFFAVGFHCHSLINGVFIFCFSIAVASAPKSIPIDSLSLIAIESTKTKRFFL